MKINLYIMKKHLILKQLYKEKRISRNGIENGNLN